MFGITENDVTELLELMQGSFNSRNQSLTDSNYYDITLQCILYGEVIKILFT